MKKFYNALNDGMFKAIFCNENNRDLLERLIYETIKIKVKVKSAVAKEIPKHNIYIKGKTLDVVCETEDNKILNIEINNYATEILRKRNFGYGAQLYCDAIKVGEDYDKIPDIHQINLTTTKEDIPDYEIYQIRGKRYGETYIKNFTIYEFNLTKLKKSCYNEFKFLNILSSNKEELKRYKGDREMEKLSKEVKKLNDDSKFVEFLTNEEEYEKLVNTYHSVGYKEGIEQGINQGIDKATKEMALKMIEQNINYKIISSVTGLNIKEIEDLK